MSHILAFDVGTTAVKAVLVDWINGTMEYAKADCTLFHPKARWAEQDAEELWQAVCMASRECVEKSGVSVDDIEGMVISAPWRHAILLDEEGRPLRNSVIWMDSRSGLQADKINAKMGTFATNASGHWARLLWLKENEPVLWAKAKYVVGLNSFFKYRATGALITECSDDFIHSPNPKLQAHYDRILEAAGLTEDLEKFPPMGTSTGLAGTLTSGAALEMGLREGLPVFGGFGDLPAVYFGSGSVEPETAHIYIGTSSWFGELMPERVADYSSSYFTADAQHEGALFGLTTGGRAFDWSIERFYSKEKEALKEAVYAFVEREIETVEAGCDGLIVTHWLNGEPRPLGKNAKGLFFNVSELHDRRHFVRAMMESICYSHRRALDKYVELHGKLPKKIRVVGGGATSKVWMQMLADVLKVPVYVPENPRYVGTFGSCYCALIGLGYKKDFSDLAGEKAETRYEPRKETGLVYDKMYRVYQGLYPALQALYDEMNGPV